MIRFIFAAAFMIVGMVIFILEVLGTFSLKYVLNRMHAAAMGDTLGILFFMIGLIILYGFSLASLKILLVIGFFWMASPAASHLLAQLEVFSNTDNPKKYATDRPGEPDLPDVPETSWGGVPLEDFSIREDVQALFEEEERREQAPVDEMKGE